jgi:hypothetical protein
MVIDLREWLAVQAAFDLFWPEKPDHLQMEIKEVI